MKTWTLRKKRERTRSNKRINKADRPQKQGNQGGKKLVALSLGDRIFRQGGNFPYFEKNQENTDKKHALWKKGMKDEQEIYQTHPCLLKEEVNNERRADKDPRRKQKI